MNKSLVAAASILLAVLCLRQFATGRESKIERDAGSAATSVLVELFTSEGCSDCPPADAVLQNLDQAQPVKGVDLIVLSEHVDYWNHLGWRDPYSSHAYSERQLQYSKHFKLSGVYTPQMVVDGNSEFVGSDKSKALGEIQKAARNVKVLVTLATANRRDASLETQLRVSPLPASMLEDAAEVFVAVADELDESHVGAGENSGRSLQHVAVLRKLIPVGSISKTAGFERDVTVNLDKGTSDQLKVVAFVQTTGPGRVLGAASVHVSR